MISEQTKQAIADKLKEYVVRYDSQSKAANSLRGVSSATINQMLNQKWDLISEDMWFNVSGQIGYSDNDWVIVETRDYKIMTALLNDARMYSNVFAATGNAGTGKTVAVRQFASENKRVYLLQCNEYWNRKMFLQELLTSMGCDYSGYSVGEMMAEAVRTLKIQQNPLIILDEADKLSDQVMYFFITLYNSLEEHCGIVMCATDHLKKRIMRGLKLNKKGYKEIYSRIGRRFVELKGLGTSDIAAVCMANGVPDRKAIREVIDDCENDLRRVKRKIHAIKKKSSGEAIDPENN